MSISKKYLKILQMLDTIASIFFFFWKKKFCIQIEIIFIVIFLENHHEWIILNGILSIPAILQSETFEKKNINCIPFTQSTSRFINWTLTHSLLWTNNSVAKIKQLNVWNENKDITSKIKFLYTGISISTKCENFMVFWRVCDRLYHLPCIVNTAMV